MPKTTKSQPKRRLQSEPAAGSDPASRKARISAAAAAAAAAGAAKATAEQEQEQQQQQKKKKRSRINYGISGAIDRRFWGLVLTPSAAVGSARLEDQVEELAGKPQRVGRDYQLHITSATLMLDEGATRKEVAAARCQLWVAMCSVEDADLDTAASTHPQFPPT